MMWNDFKKYAIFYLLSLISIFFIIGTVIIRFYYKKNEKVAIELPEKVKKMKEDLAIEIAVGEVKIVAVQDEVKQIKKITDKRKRREAYLALYKKINK